MKKHKDHNDINNNNEQSRYFGNYDNAPQTEACHCGCTNCEQSETENECICKCIECHCDGQPEGHCCE